MLSGIKNFAIDAVLRRIADNPKLDHATNVLAVIPVMIGAATTGQANWVLMLGCCSAPASLHEVVRVVGLVVSAALLWCCGKCTWLKSWLPVVDEVIQEAEKEADAK